MRRRELKYFRKYSTAQAMVEFLIVLPIMLLLVMGILQFSFIYQAKTTLNYAVFQTARSGSLNNINMSAMEMAFSSNMAPLYTSSYLTINSSGVCESSFFATDAGRASRLGGAQIMDNGTRSVLEANITNFNSENVLCARRLVQEQIEDGYVNITVVNPTIESFASYGVDAEVIVDGSGGTTSTQIVIPNDNLMYRDVNVSGAAGQSIQDANLLKIHVGYCYELIVPFVDRIIWAMQRYGPGAAPAEEKKYGRLWADDASTPPGFFGPPASGSFAESCINNPADNNRLSIVLYSQGIMRMQSTSIECNLDSSC